MPTIKTEGLDRDEMDNMKDTEYCRDNNNNNLRTILEVKNKKENDDEIGTERKELKSVFDIPSYWLPRFSR